MSFATALVRLARAAVGIVALETALGAVRPRMDRARVPGAIIGLTLAPLSLAGFAGWVRIVERRPVTELEPSAALRELSAGFAIGLGLMTATIGVMAVRGAYVVRGFGDWYAVGGGVLAASATAVAEEIVFRGFLFRTLREVAGTWPAVATTATAFGVRHRSNPGATAWSSLAIALETGVLLALAYDATDRLWLPIGIHLGWNVALGPIFGTRVSGGVPGHVLLRAELRGRPGFTGGEFGPEASIAAVVICLAASAVLSFGRTRR